MSPLLFLASLALAQDADYDRLFGGEAAPAAANTAAELPANGWAWPALLAGAGVVAAWQLRKKVQSTGAQAGMRVVQRQVVGDKSSLILVEVDDGKGNARRLLLGSSPGGVALVQDLGANELAEAVVELAPVLAPEPASAEPAVAPAARARVDAFARVLDEVMEERGLDTPPAAPDFDENGFFASRPAPSTGRFFTEEDLAPAVPAQVEEPKRALRPIAPSVPPPVAVAPRPLPMPAPRVTRAAVPAPAPAAEEPRKSLVALLGGKAEAAPRGRVFSAAGTVAPVPTVPVAATLPGVAPVVAAPTVAAAAPVLAAAPVRVGPPLQDPRLLAPPQPLRLAPAPGTPEPPLPSTRDLLARLSQREQHRATGTETARARSASLDDRVRRFEKVVAEGRR